VLELQERNGIPPAIAIVIRSGQQVLLASEAQRFFRRSSSIRPVTATCGVCTRPSWRRRLSSTLSFVSVVPPFRE